MAILIDVTGLDFSTVQVVFQEAVKYLLAQVDFNQDVTQTKNNSFPTCLHDINFPLKKRCLLFSIRRLFQLSFKYLPHSPIPMDDDKRLEQPKKKKKIKYFEITLMQPNCACYLSKFRFIVQSNISVRHLLTPQQGCGEKRESTWTLV